MACLTQQSVILLLVCGGITWCTAFEFDTSEICDNAYASHEVRNLCLQLQSAKLLDDRDHLIEYWLSSSRDRDERPTSLEDNFYGDTTVSNDDVSGYAEKRNKMDGNYIRFGRNNAIDLLNSYLSSFGTAKKRSSPSGGKFMRFGRSVSASSRRGNSSEAVTRNEAESPSTAANSEADSTNVTPGVLWQKYEHKLPHVQFGQHSTSSKNDIENSQQLTEEDGKSAAQKRFMRFGERMKDKRFMRFGRNSDNLQQLLDKDNLVGKDKSRRLYHAKDVDQPISSNSEEKRFIRFGKSSSIIDDGNSKRFMRFGKRPAKLEDEMRPAKRFMRFGKRNNDQNELASKEDIHYHLKDKNDKALSGRILDGENEKRFMRFGKRNNDQNELSSKDDIHYHLKDKNDKELPERILGENEKRFMRFGKRDLDGGKQGLRFEKKDDGQIHGQSERDDVNKRFMRFGKRQNIAKDKRFMRFGKRQDSSADDGDDEMMNKRFMRFGRRDRNYGMGERGVDKRFMRFGKREDGIKVNDELEKRFMRFGKRNDDVDENRPTHISYRHSQKRFMRFGKRSNAQTSNAHSGSDAHKRFMRFGKRQAASTVNEQKDGIAQKYLM